MQDWSRVLQLLMSLKDRKLPMSLPSETAPLLSADDISALSRLDRALYEILRIMFNIGFLEFREIRFVFASLV